MPGASIVKDVDVEEPGCVSGAISATASLMEVNACFAVSGDAKLFLTLHKRFLIGVAIFAHLGVKLRQKLTRPTS